MAIIQLLVEMECRSEQKPIAPCAKCFRIKNVNDVNLCSCKTTYL